MAGKILITPSAGSTTVDPTIAFQGAGVSTDIVLRVPSVGGLSFEGVNGQLFSITDSMSGTIYSVNDISGIPSIEVLDTGLVKIAQYSGNLVLGSASDDGYKFQVAGTSSYTGDTLHKANARTCYGPNTSWGTYLIVGGDGVNGITRTCGIASIVTTDGNMHIDSGNVKGMYLNFYSGNQGVIFGNGATGQVACIGSGGNLCTASCVATAGMVCAGTCILGNSYLCVPNCVMAGGAVCGGTVYSAGCIQAGTCVMAATYMCSATCVIAAGSLCGANATVGCCITAVSTYASNCVCGQAIYGYSWVCSGAGNITSACCLLAAGQVCAGGMICSATCLYAPCHYSTGGICAATCLGAGTYIYGACAYIGCICTSSGGVISCTYMCTHTGNITSACCVLSAGPITIGGSVALLNAGGNLQICSCGYYMCLGPLNSTWAHMNTNATSGFYMYCTLCNIASISSPNLYGKLGGCADCSYCSCCALYAYCTCGNVTGSASSTPCLSSFRQPNETVNTDTVGVSGINYFSGGTGNLYGDGALYQQSYAPATSTWGSQIMQDYRTGCLAVRGRCNGGWTTWLYIVPGSSTTYTNYCSYCSCCSNCATCSPCMTGAPGAGWSTYAVCSCCSGCSAQSAAATYACTLTNNSSTSASNYPIAWWSGNTLYSTPSGLCVYPSTCGMYIAGCIWTSTCVVSPGFAGRLSGCSDCSYCSCCALYAYCTCGNVTGSSATTGCATCAYYAIYAGNMCPGTNINGSNICATACFCGPYYNASGYFYGPTVYATSCLCSCGVFQGLSHIYTSGGNICSACCINSAGQIGSSSCVIAGGYLYTSNWVCAASGLCTPGYICSTGIIYSAGNIVAYNTSDCRLKNNVSNLTCAICKIKQIRGVEYDWTEEEIARSSVGYFKTHDVGVIAQEVELVLPEAVANRDDGYKGVRYEKLIPLLIEAIKEQQVEIEQLQARI